MSVHVDEIKEYIINNPKLKDLEIAKLIGQDYGLNKKEVEKLRKRVYSAKRTVNKGKEQKEKSNPKVVRERYKWETMYGKIDFPVSQIDELFYQYSKHGLNMSQTAIINTHNLESWQWQSIKRKLELFKDSNIFSPHTVNKYEGEELDKMINDRISRKFKNKGRLVEEAYRKQTIKAYNKVIEENDKRILERDIFYNEILELLPKANIKNVVVRNKKAKLGHAVITLADLHNGARVENIQNTRDFNPEILRQYLKETARIVNEKQYSEISIAILGDLIESFTGLNHKNSWKGIEYGYYGSKVIIETVELLTEFISSLHNVTEIIGVNGNHDRSTSDNKEDTKGEIGTVIFYMLKNIYRDVIDVIHHEDVVNKEIDGIHYIVSHGHLTETKKGSDKIINEYGNNRKFNLILTGHLHSRIILEDNRNSRHLVCPSYFTGNRYSKTLAFSTLPGFLIIENNGNDYPQVTDIPL